MHYITYKVIGFFLNKNIKLVAAAVELLLFLRLLHTSILLLLSFRHFELLNSERAKATFENRIVKSGSCLADEIISSEQLYLRNVEEFTTAWLIYLDILHTRIRTLGTVKRLYQAIHQPGWKLEDERQKICLKNYIQNYKKNRPTCQWREFGQWYATGFFILSYFQLNSSNFINKSKGGLRILRRLEGRGGNIWFYKVSRKTAWNWEHLDLPLRSATENFINMLKSCDGKTNC